MLDFREVLIRWIDETEWQQVTVAVGGDWSLNDNDDVVFFYFDNEEEYQDCLVNGGDDFDMREEAGDE